MHISGAWLTISVKNWDVGFYIYVTPMDAMLGFKDSRI